MISSVLSQVTYPGLSLEWGHEGSYWWLRVVCPEGSPLATDTRDGSPLSWKGRKWRLSKHMTAGELVQTAFMAILAALEHEAREQFRYKGVDVLNPHMDLEALVEVAGMGHKGRD